MDYLKNGYVLIKGLWTPEKIELLHDDVLSVFRYYTGDWEGPADALVAGLFAADNEGFRNCARQCQNLPGLAERASDPSLARILRQHGVIKPVFNTRPLLSISSRATAADDTYWKVPAHQDWPSMQGSLNGVTVWCPLVRVTDALGPLEVVPGSHLAGSRRFENYQETPVLADPIAEGEFVPVPMDRGDVLIMNTFLVHRSGHNTHAAGGIRWSAHFRYDDLACRDFRRRKYPLNHESRRKVPVHFPNAAAGQETTPTPVAP